MSVFWDKVVNFFTNTIPELFQSHVVPVWQLWVISILLLIILIIIASALHENEKYVHVRRQRYDQTVKIPGTLKKPKKNY